MLACFLGLHAQRVFFICCLTWLLKCKKKKIDLVLCWDKRAGMCWNPHKAQFCFGIDIEQWPYFGHPLSFGEFLERINNALSTKRTPFNKVVFLIPPFPFTLQIDSCFFCFSTAWGALAVNNIRSTLESVHAGLSFSPNIKLKPPFVLCSLAICRNSVLFVFVSSCPLTETLL